MEIKDDYLHIVLSGDPMSQNPELFVYEVNRNKARQYETPRTAQSLIIFTSSSESFIEKALLESSETVDSNTVTSDNDQITADNG